MTGETGAAVARPLWQGRMLALLVAFSLRSAVAALSPLLALGAVLLIAIPAGVIVARPTTIEDDWEQRHGRWS
ncbi:hypothetical protein [Microbacterium sp. bgisy189]|uniref:hypothetical protein n=1 Tax=Microbacterium sp. bgisy189 TaxID=3413798 RepID=UPI003EB88C1F